MRTLVDPDRRQADAVDARQEVDLRLGAAFTRFQVRFSNYSFLPIPLMYLLLRLLPVQTKLLQDRFRLPQNADGRSLVSYGPCQFPTLGFVVERWDVRASALAPEQELANG